MTEEKPKQTEDKNMEEKPKQCPKCGMIIPTYRKSWDMKTFKGVPEKAYMYLCPKCGHRFNVIIVMKK